jgi:tetratricopeptide (TPR) repeat protein
MRLALSICILGVILVTCGCRSGSQTNVPVSTSGVAVPGAGSGNHSEARSLLEKGKELYRSDQDSEAAKAFEQAVKLDPDLAEAHFRLGLSYEADNKADEAELEYKKAIEAYKKYLEDNSKDAEAHYQFGQVYAAIHQYSDAVREYRQATKLRPDDGDIYYDLGMALMKLAQYDAAVAAYSKALEIDPEDYRAQDSLEEAKEGVARIKAGRKHQEDLLKKQKEDELKKAGEVVPGSTPGKNATGWKVKN